MTLEELMESWRKDSPIDETRIDQEALNVPRLHSKYLIILAQERLLFKWCIAEKQRIELRLEDYFTGKIEGRDIGREPLRLQLPRDSIKARVARDPELDDINKKYNIQEEKLLFLKEVIISINSRGYAIKNYIDYMKWSNGQI